MAISSNPTEISITYNVVCMINMTILSNPTEITGANNAHLMMNNMFVVAKRIS